MAIKIGDHTIEPTIFPDGTSQVWKLPDEVFEASPMIITWEYQTEAEFMHLVQLQNLLLWELINRAPDIQNLKKIALYLPYLPYGRQDKQVSNQSTFALRSFAQQLNSLRFHLVEIMDPHSDVAIEVIDHCIPRYPRRQVEHVHRLFQADIVCYPDEGAREKYTQIYDYPFVAGEKVREQDTGYITNYELHGDVAGKRVLIVDDICDGGATFTRLADALRDAGALAVALFVTHGLFSRGLRPLHNAGIRHIYTHKGEAVQLKDAVGWKAYDYTQTAA